MVNWLYSREVRAGSTFVGLFVDEENQVAFGGEEVEAALLDLG